MRVVNCTRERCTHYCGRPSSRHKALGTPEDRSLLGNPYNPWNHSTEPEENIEAFRVWLWEEARRESYVWRSLVQLPEDALLGCFCKPGPCHCDVILRAWYWHHGKPLPL